MQQEFNTPGIGETSVSPLALASVATVVAALAAEWWLTLWLVLNTFAAMICGLFCLGLLLAPSLPLTPPPGIRELAIPLALLVLFVGWAILCSWCKRGIVQARSASATIAMILTGTVLAVVTGGLSLMLVFIAWHWGNGSFTAVAILLIVASGPMMMLQRTLVALRRLSQCLREEEHGGFPVEMPPHSRAVASWDE